MSIISSPRSDLPGKLRGLHLFHYSGAPCAQRVRFVLAEKGIRRGRDVPWSSDAPEHLVAEPGSYLSRPVSLPRQQNLTAEYAAIHPNLVVPALVHDGVLHIESVDIMNYVNEELPGPALVPEGERGEQCRKLLARASELHRSVRFVTFRWSLGGLAKLKKEEQERVASIDAADSPEQLAAFYRDFSNDTIPTEVFAGHVHELERGFAELEKLLGDGRAWLTGETFSMADVIWSVKTLRIFEAGYPFRKRFPAVHAWFERVRARPSFREAIWRDAWLFSRVFQLKGAIQNRLGRGLESVASAA